MTRLALLAAVALGVAHPSATSAQVDPPRLPPWAEIGASAFQVVQGGSVVISVTAGGGEGPLSGELIARGSTPGDAPSVVRSFEGREAISDTVRVAPDVTTTYVFGVVDGAGSRSDAAAVTVRVSPRPVPPRPPAPSATLTAWGDTLSVPRGTLVSLRVGSAFDTARVLTSPDSALTLREDRAQFEAGESGWFVFTVRGAGGAATDSLWVEVLDPPTARIRVEASPGGDSLELTFRGEGNADSGTIVPGALNTLDTTLVVSSTQAATYAFVVSGPGGTDVATHTVIGQEAPGPSNERLRLTPVDRSRPPCTIATPSDLGDCVSPIDFPTPYVLTVEDASGTEDIPVILGGSPWSVALGVGAVGIVTRPASFVVPTVSVSAVHMDELFLTVRGGWRPGVGSRPEALMAFDASYFLSDRVGVAATALRAWELADDTDYWFRRGQGVGLGPRVRLLESRALVVGLDLQYTQVRLYDALHGHLKFGITPSVTYRHVIR